MLVTVTVKCSVLIIVTVTLQCSVLLMVTVTLKGCAHYGHCHSEISVLLMVTVTLQCSVLLTVTVTLKFQCSLWSLSLCSVQFSLWSLSLCSLPLLCRGNNVPSPRTASSQNDAAKYIYIHIYNAI